MWNVKGKPVDVKQFTPFAPARVLYEFDGPRSFTLLDAQGELCFVHWCDEDGDVGRYLVVPFTSQLMERLQRGELSVRDALDQPRVYVVDVDSKSGQVKSACLVRLADLPGDALPQPGVLLLPALEREARPVDLEGRIRELDKDRLIFELRDIHGHAAQKFVFSVTLLDDVVEALQTDRRVRVGGRTIPSLPMAHALAISRAV